MNNRQIKLFQEYKDLDALFLLLKFTTPLHEKEAIIKFYDSFPESLIREGQLIFLLEKLKTDKHVTKSVEGILEINPLSRNYRGYMAEFLMIEGKLKREKMYAYTFKVLPIILGIATIYISILNYRLEGENSKISEENKGKDEIISKLQSDARMNNQKIHQLKDTLYFLRKK